MKIEKQQLHIEKESYPIIKDYLKRAREKRGIFEWKIVTDLIMASIKNDLYGVNESESTDDNLPEGSINSRYSPNPFTR